MISRRVSALLVAWLAYAAIGIGFAALPPLPGGGRPFRLGAWIASAIVFACHTIYEQRRIEARPTVAATALRVASAAALGAFVVAISANLHHANGAAGNGMIAALVIWPLATMIPAFVVAAALASIVRVSV